MKIGVLPIAKMNSQVISRIQENLEMTFPKTTCQLIHETTTIPEDTYEKTREQYNADTILSKIHDYAEKEKAFDRVLGIVDVDIYSPELNFVFGKAETPGKAALISVWRLKPEFYKAPQNFELFVERSTKEAVHELGHTLGLMHCSNPFCVMYFSNSIFDTDRKQSLFCNVCYLKIEKIGEKRGNSFE